MNPILKIQFRSVYGVDRVYPACREAEVFAQIAGTKTLEPRTLSLIRSLGYRIIEVDRFGGAVGELVAA